MVEHRHMQPIPDRVLLRYHGGKDRLVDWILPMFPEHDIYVEPFGGGGSLLLNKPRAKHEVYNDIEDEVVNLFAVLANPEMAAELLHRLHHTPYGRTQFFEAKKASFDLDDPVRSACHLITRIMMGFGSKGIHQAGFRTGSRGRKAEAAYSGYAGDWVRYTDNLPIIVERLRGVQIEHLDAKKVMQQHDSRATLHYLDPPYIQDAGNVYYKHDMSVEDHRVMLKVAKSLEGMVLISGYPNKLYDKELATWHQEERGNHTDRHNKRTEVVWLNSRARAKQSSLRIT